MKKQNLLLAHLSMFFANVIFAFNIPNVKMVLSSGEFPVLALNFARVSGGALCFWIASMFVERERVPRKDLFKIFLASVLGVQLNQLAFISATSLTSPVDISIIATLIPIITMCLAALYLKEPITLKKTAGIVVGAVGVLMVVLTSNQVSSNASNPILGNLIFLASLFFFGSYLTLFKPLITRYKPITFMKWMFLFAAICQIPVCYNAVNGVDFVNMSSHVAWGITFTVVAASFISYTMLGYGQKMLRPTVVSMYNYVQPFVVFGIAMYFGQESFDYRKIIAAVLVFSGVYVVTQSKAKSGC